MLKSIPMKTVCFLTHPDVLLNQAVPITEWGLSESGRKKAVRVSDRKWISKVEEIYSSKETKARETAQIISNKLNVECIFVEELGEIDRSSTGYMELEKFKEAVDSFFSEPRASHRGWETAVQAQKRITSIVFDRIVKNSIARRLLIVSHGGVGALLMADLLEKSISREYCQESQGSYFLFRENKKLVKKWTKLR